MGKNIRLAIAFLLVGLTVGSYFQSKAEAGLGNYFRALDESSTPCVGQRVFYQMKVYQNPDGTVPNVQRKAAAIITHVYDGGTVDLFVMEPDKAYGRVRVPFDSERSPGTWATIQSGDLQFAPFPE